MLFLLSFIACKGDLLANAGEFGRILYTLETDYKIDGFKLTEAKIATGYPQRISASLTPSGWKMVGDEPFSVYHVSADEDNLVVDSESLLDGEVGVPGFTVQGNAAGSFTIESKLQDEIVDQIALNFVVPDKVSLLSWVRGPNTEEFGEEEGDNIKISVGSQAAFIPIPQFEGERIIGDLEVEISIDPPEAAVEGYNIESVQEGGVVASSNPPSVYFVQKGEVEVCAKDVVNEIEDSCQKFTVE